MPHATASEPLDERAPPMEEVRNAARLASPRARVLPAAVSVKACLCAPRDFSDVGGAQRLLSE
eukprot:797386-Alexandrium_andersonii.AAC.1